MTIEENKTQDNKDQKISSKEKKDDFSTRKSDLLKRKIGALWVRTSGAGNKYLGGEIEIKGKEKIRIMILKNNNKTQEKFPDYEIYVQNSEVAKDFPLE